MPARGLPVATVKGTIYEIAGEPEDRLFLKLPYKDGKLNPDTKRAFLDEEKQRVGFFLELRIVSYDYPAAIGEPLGEPEPAPEIKQQIKDEPRSSRLPGACAQGA